MSSSDLPPFLRTIPPPTAPPSIARLQALYASTSSQRTTNPTGYKANYQWWSSVIEETLRTGWLNGEEGDRLILKVDDSMLSKLEDNLGRRPKGIGGVIDGMINTTPPTLYLLSTYLSSLTPLHAPPSLTSRFIGKPLWWAVSQLNPFGSSSETIEKEDVLWSRYGKGKEYVHIPLLEQSASAFIAHLSKNPILSYTDALFDMDTFSEGYGEICLPSSSSSKKLPAGIHKLSNKDIEVLIKWLNRDCGLIVSDGKIIKILEADQIPTDHPITEADKGVISVINAQRKVEKQIIGIEEQINQSQEKAKKQLAKGQKTTALSYLRSKKQLEDLLAKRISSSEQLGTVIRSIDQAKGDVEIMSAYETSTITLKSILSNPSLSIEKIENTTNLLAEVIADQEEIDQAIKIGGELSMNEKRIEIDEEELVSELAELVKEEKVLQDKVKEQEKAEPDKRKKEKQDLIEQIKRKEEKEREKQETEEMKNQAKVNNLSSLTSQNTGELNKFNDDEEWERRYQDAQIRKEAEIQRSLDERLRKEEKRIAAD
ncbi:uncharacterized protein I206_102165 [Kwoniella pini CBS 10737]|uniref:Charged multivesicular body protein 7 n=1 Tax=Kwoniella pini CBS 10737 TaxID=1296096 RepID=A0A1B9HUM0_9TREE|nr:charged multivesicular body protein 7 [Kwoniella pini CBS 10737]OCF46966.1 charged multivesicular body protein 7 [Kwoniella pini CBS 10737]